VAKKKKPAAPTAGGSQFMARHNLKGILVPVTEEVRDLVARASTASGSKSMSKWTAEVLEEAARKALGEPALARPPGLPEAVTEALEGTVAVLRAQATYLDGVRKRVGK
jgi:alpha-amylase/alpha-mannosidase (GH57 family)